MSIKCQNWVIENSPYSAVTYLVHVMIGDTANEDNDYLFWMSQETLAKKCHITRTTVNKALKRLIDDGYLTEIKHSTGRGNTNMYRFNMPKVLNPVDESVKDITLLTEESVKDTTESVNDIDTNSIELKDTKNSNRTKAQKEKDEYSETFEKAWKLYPRKVGKPAAFKNWKTRIKQGATKEQLLLSATNYADECKRENRESKYVKHGSTFWGPDEWFKDYLDDNSSEEALSSEEPDNLSSPSSEEEQVTGIKVLNAKDLFD